LPALAQARAKARQTSCLNNLKQVYLGFALFAQDNEGKIPPPEGTIDDPSVAENHPFCYINWTNFIRPVLEPGLDPDDIQDWPISMDSIYYCPNAKNAVLKFQNDNSLPVAPHTCYIIHTVPRPDIYTYPERSVKDKFLDGNFILTEDGREFTGASNIWLLKDPPEGSSGWTPFLHSGGVNVLYLDGHALWEKL